MSQWSSLSNTFKAQVKLKGNKPRVGVALTGIEKYYSRGQEFSMIIPTIPFSAMSVFQKNAGQSGIANNSYTKLQWSATKDFDDNNDFSNERFAPSVAGKYLITGHVWLKADSVNINAGDILALAVYKNGSIHKRADIGFASTGNFESPMVSVIVEAKIGDYFELFLYQNTGVTTNTISTSEVAPISVFSYFQATLLTKDNNPLPSFSAYMSAKQAGLGNGSWTLLAMDTEDWDSEGTYNNGATHYHWTPSVAGKYLLTGHLLLESGSMILNDLFAIGIFKNGSQIRQAEVKFSSTGNMEGPTISVIVDTDGTDEFDLRIWQNTGASTIPSGEATGGISIYCYFQGCGLAANNMPSFSAYQANTGQINIASGVFTKLIWTSEDWDVDGDFGSSKWIPGTEGKYIITAHCWLDSDGGGIANGELLAICLYKNGQIYKQAEIKYVATGSNFHGPQLCCIAEANGDDDYFELYIYQTTGSTQKTITTGDVGTVKIHTYFQGCGIVAIGDTSDIVNTFTDELANAPSLSINSKMTGGLSTINRLNVNILNQDLVSDLFVEGGDYADPENTDVKAYLVFDSGSTLLADSIQFFRGMIDDFPEINQNSLRISCTSIDKRIFKKIGDLITNNDATSGYQLPEDSLGRIKPIIYGDHRFAVNFTKDNNQLASNYQFTRENNVVETIPLGGGQFLIANHKVNSINSNGDGIWLFDDVLGKMVEVEDFTVIQNTDAGCIISIQGTQVIAESLKGEIDNGVHNNFRDDTTIDFTHVSTLVQAGDILIILNGNNIGTYHILSITDADNLIIQAPYFAADGNDVDISYRIERYPKVSDWRSPNNANTADGWTAIESLYDLDIDVAAEVTQDAGDSGLKTVEVNFEIFPYQQALVLSTKVYVLGKWDDDDGNFYLMVNWSSAFNFTDRTNETQFQTHTGSQYYAFINDVQIAYGKVAGGNDGTAYIYEVIEKITYFINIATESMKIYFGGLGYGYASWISNRTSHQDDPGLDNLIENAAGCVESLMRDVLLLGNSNINNTAFDAASSGDLASSKLSFSITKRTESDKLIHDILERVKSVGYFDYDDQFKMVVYNSSANFTEAGSGTPNDDDIFMLNASESGSLSLNTRQFDEHPIIKDSFWIKKNPAAQIITNFTVEYYKTYNDKFARTLLDTDNDYHDEDISKIFSHPYTKDQTTAQIWLTFLIDRLNRKHWMAGWDTWYNAIGKEMWDVVNVQHPVIENLLTDYATKKWRILSLDIQTDLGKISVEVEEQ